MIPREIRRQAALEPGTPIEIRLRDGVIELEPAPLKVRLERRGRLLVAVPEGDVPPLEPQIVEETRRRVRERSD